MDARPMELADTVAGMTSQDYRERFRAEHDQLRIRVDKLDTMLERWDEGTLGFEPTCPRDLLVEQLQAMLAYMDALEQRAEIEGVPLRG